MRTPNSSGELVPLVFNLGADLMGLQTHETTYLEPGDRVYLFNNTMNRSRMMQQDLDRLKKQSSFIHEPNIVSAIGLVTLPGDYPLTQGMRASNLLCAANGLLQRAHGITAELSRMSVDISGKPQIKHKRLDTLDLINICEARQREAKHSGKRLIQDSIASHPSKKSIRQIQNVIDPIRFETGDITVSEESLKKLRSTLLELRQPNVALSIVVSGHTDTTPLTDRTAALYKNNMGLSKARADAVAKIIRSFIEDESITLRSEGKGDAYPMALNGTVMGRQLNRRVEVKIEVRNKVRSEETKTNLTRPRKKVLNDSPHLQLAEERDPFLLPGDHITFTEKPGWREVKKVQLFGEFTRPGIYIVDRNETLCSVIKRAGGITDEAWTFGAEFTRVSTKRLQQKTLDGIREQLDDLMVELSLSHSANNQEKTPAGTDKEDYFKILNQLKKATPNGRQVINFNRASACEKNFDLVMEDGDQLRLPIKPRMVTVSGQVYVPTSHVYDNKRTIRDYITLSGGPTVIGRLKDTYAIQANGEVVGLKGRGFKRFFDQKTSPGSVVYVPLNVDRMNTTEKLQTWTRSLVEVALVRWNHTLKRKRSASA